MGRTRDDYSSLPSLHELHDNIPSTALPKPILSGMWTSQSGKSRKKTKQKKRAKAKEERKDVMAEKGLLKGREEREEEKGEGQGVCGTSGRGWPDTE